MFNLILKKMKTLDFYDLKVKVSILLVFVLFVSSSLSGQKGSVIVSRPFYEVYYSPSEEPGGLVFGVTYRFWIPTGVKSLRGIIVHQHGCGAPAARMGATAADDLHWQALAKKWDCALVAPCFKNTEGSNFNLDDNCVKWYDPSQGSDKAFLTALTDMGRLSGHPELEKVPWLLWGHSGGAHWVGNMTFLHPDRVLCLWLRSGSPNIKEIPKSAYSIPIILNLGLKERDDSFSDLFESATSFFIKFRKNGGIIGFAPDPNSSHDCGTSRYLAIPFFDLCLSQRLSKNTKYGLPLRPMAKGVTRPVPVLKDTDVDVWLPDDNFANLWAEYITTGEIPDNTPPPAPSNVRVNKEGVLTWDCEADLESGIGGFVIERDGKDLVSLPEKPSGMGRPMFQEMSYHDTPSLPLVKMSYRDSTATSETCHIYEIMAVNTWGMKSAKTKALPR